jgi:hypothetical protein
MEPAKLREGLRKQGIHVAEGDPVLELVSICEIALAETVQVIERITKQEADRVAAASTRAVADAENVSEKLVTEAGIWAETRIKAAGEAAAAMVIREIRSDLLKAQRASRTAISAAWITGIMSGITLCGLLGNVFASLRHH